MTDSQTVCVIGAGISGLVTARVLKRDGFDVTVRPTGTDAAAETHAFDYVVVCNGVFSEPFVPDIQGQDRFDGSLIHSSQMRNRAMPRGKRVVVVGGGNSAFDCARVAGQEAQSATLLCRNPHWMLPRDFPSDLFQYEMLLSRYAAAVGGPAYCRASGLETAVRTAAAPALWLLWYGMSRLFRRLSGIPASMVPDQLPAYDMGRAGYGTDFYEMMRDGEAHARRTEMQSFTRGRTLQLDTGEEIDADLVIFATGWRQDLSLLNPELQEVVKREGRFQLYRHILPPTEQRLGFVGYASSTNNMLTSEIAAHWLSECFLGALALPDVQTMNNAIAERHDWGRRSSRTAVRGIFSAPTSPTTLMSSWRTWGSRPVAKTVSSRNISSRLRWSATKGSRTNDAVLETGRVLRFQIIVTRGRNPPNQQNRSAGERSRGNVEETEQCLARSAV
ncbi:MAG: hypothetical protein BRD55_10555 [Bacteroidetes bacterium SW_9_63_38]|nr:MAG: hypothetical protein BRD55_10555 [Bacteroidetes bacterium SW_9_63_38]